MEMSLHSSMGLSSGWRLMKFWRRRNTKRGRVALALLLLFGCEVFRMWIELWLCMVCDGLEAEVGKVQLVASSYSRHEVVNSHRE